MRDSMRDVVVVVPIYKPQLADLDAYSLNYSLDKLRGRDILFICPNGLDVGFYQDKYPGANYLRFDGNYFSSVQGYSNLLLSIDFYEKLEAYKFVLILQTDAILLEDGLDYWVEKSFDYIGAPWPGGMSQWVNFDKFSGGSGIQVRAHVGNGGLSLRSVKKCIALIKEFPDAVEVYRANAFNEDCYFAVMGSLSLDFKIPNQISASLFSLELSPRHYFGITKINPMGSHGWWKYDALFWLERLTPLPPKDALLKFLMGEKRDAEVLAVNDFYDKKLTDFIDEKVLRMDVKSVETYLDTHLEFRNLPIQVDISDEDHERLFLRIKNQWTDYGENEPYASVLSDEKFLMAKVHANMAEFNASGGDPVAWLALLAARNGISIPGGTCFELGCGVGRITKHLAGTFEKVLAADISPGNLAVCEKYLQEVGVENVQPMLLTHPHDVDALPGFDAFVSIIVLQHNPPPIQYYLLDKILGKISNGGVCLFQTATYNPGYSYSVDYQLGLGEDDFRRWSLHCLPMRFITKLLRKHGFDVCEVIQDKMAGGLSSKFHSHTFFAVKNT